MRPSCSSRSAELEDEVQGRGLGPNAKFVYTLGTLTLLCVP